MKYLVFLMIFTLVGGIGMAAAKTVTFNAPDGILVTADVYLAHPDRAPLIVCFHQARSSRGEYEKIAPKLNELGFNVLAVDQRSGGMFGGIINQTAAEAGAKGKPTSYLDALADMKAAVGFARRQYAKGKILIWGSSYSASLVLKMAGDNPAVADGVLAFSPGEYFAPPKSGDFITLSAEKITIPVFITSAKSEQTDWQMIYEAIPSKAKIGFLPTSAGEHGSSALYSPSAGQYWKAVEKFLKQFRILH